MNLRKKSRKKLSSSCLDTFGVIYHNQNPENGTTQMTMGGISDRKNIVASISTIGNHIQLLIEHGIISKSRPDDNEYFEGGRGPNIYKILKQDFIEELRGNKTHE